MSLSFVNVVYHFFGRSILEIYAAGNFEVSLTFTYYLFKINCSEIPTTKINCMGHPCVAAGVNRRCEQ